MTRDELIERIKEAKIALMFAGPIHSKDLKKHIYRMEKDLKTYDEYHRRSKNGQG